MEWTVITVIVTVFGFIAGVVTPIVKLNTTITKLTAQVDTFIKGLEEFKVRYTNQLEEFKETHNDLYEKVDDHERRITTLEVKKDYR